MKIKQITPEALIPYAKNPRSITRKAIDETKKSILNTAGKLQRPIVVDKDMVIIVGHTRRLAAIELGLKTVPVHIADYLNDEQIKTYRIADNKTGEFSEWSYELLAIEFEELVELEVDLSLTSFDEPLISSLLEPDTPEKEKSSGKVSDSEESPFSKKSISFHDEQITIFNDAVELARTSPIADTGVNDSATANALTLICREWLELKDKNN